MTRLAFRLVLKELREILRDRRTVVTLVLMPVLLYPLLTVGFWTLFHRPAALPVYNVGAASEQDADLLLRLMRKGEEALMASHGPEGLPQSVPDVKFLETDAMEENLLMGHIDLGIRVKRSEPGGPVVCELVFVEDSPLGLEVRNFMDRRLSAANAGVLRDMLTQTRAMRKGTDLPVRLRHTAVHDPEHRVAVSLAVLVPLVLILMTITGAVYPAIDLTAGERERGTLEVLMAAPIPRVGLLLAKFVAVVAVALLTALINLGMMTLMILLTGLSPQLFGDAGLSAARVLAVLGVMLLFAVFFSAVLLVICSFARSFKEAQAYLIPLMLASLAPGLVALVPGLPLGGVLLVTPLLNIVLLARDLFGGRAEPLAALVVVGSTAVYAVVAILLAARLFGAEGVLYGSTGVRRKRPHGAA